MKKYYIWLVLLLIIKSSNAFSQRTLKVNFSDNTEKVLLEKMFSPDSIIVVDSFGVNRDQIKTQDSTPYFYRLRYASANFASENFIWEEDLTINISPDYMLSYSSSPLNDKYKSFTENLLNPYRMTLVQLTTTWIHLSKNNDSSGIKSLISLQNEVSKFYATLINQFNQENSNTLIGLYNLMYRKRELSLDKRNTLIKEFDPQLQKHEYATFVLGNNAVDKRNEPLPIGQKIVVNDLKDINGDKMLFSNFNTPYILIDFWGTWCGPCIKALPMLRDINKRYHNQITIVSVACREEEDLGERFLKLIEKEKMNWKHVYYSFDSLEDERSSLPAVANISSYPTVIVINKEGEILYNESGYSEEKEDKLNSFLKNLTN
jgi:thiol-disulfide isomerase/thioredoxin